MRSLLTRIAQGLAVAIAIAGAVGAAAEPLLVTPLADGIFLVHSYGEYQGQPVEANGLVVTSGSCVAVIDTPWNKSQTRELLAWIEANLHHPVSFGVITHAHADRIGGIAVLQRAGIATYGNSRTVLEAKRNGFPAPDHAFASEISLRCGALTLDLFYPGAGHTRDNIAVYVRERKTLYGGCFLKSEASESLGNLADADLAAWPASLAVLRARFPDAELVVPGHGALGPGALGRTQRLLEAHRSP